MCALATAGKAVASEGGERGGDAWPSGGSGVLGAPVSWKGSAFEHRLHSQAGVHAAPACRA